MNQTGGSLRKDIFSDIFQSSEGEGKKKVGSQQSAVVSHWLLVIREKGNRQL